MMPGSCIHCDEKNDLIPICIECAHSKSGFKKAYNILMDYWSYIPDEDKESVSNRIDVALGMKPETTTADEYNKVTMVSDRADSGPLTAVSRKISTPHPDTIKNALSKLKKGFSYGIPDEKCDEDGID
jgi:hypothetical protein